MMTIGRNYQGPARNYATDCDVCGVKWHRNEMHVNGDGHLVCPDPGCGDGRTATELDQLRALSAAETAPTGRRWEP